jgi:pimeloyl-ACP methyl ester carboxylesterase
MTLPLLFLSGAGLPAWIWDEVRSGITAPSAVAPRPATGSGTVADHARAALDAAPEGSFGVVAHSAGGVVATELARIAAGRVAAVLGVAAVIPASGASFASSLPFPNKVVLPLILRVAGTRPPESAIRKGLAAGLDEETVQRLVADLDPEPLKYFTTRTTGHEAMHAVPLKKYVVTTDDAELTAGMQRDYAARLGASGVTEIASAHLPMITNSAEVIAAAQDLAESRPAVRTAEGGNR